jgi:hypothetical protein
MDADSNAANRLTDFANDLERGLMPETIAAEAAPAGAPLDARLTTRISRDADRRLRLAAVLQDLKIGEFLDQLLTRALPTYADLSVQMNGATTDER